MKAKEIMTKDVIFVDKDEDLQHVLDLMEKHEVTKIPVLENKKLVGIITDGKIAYKLGSIRKKDVPAARLHASSVMEKKFDTVLSDTSVEDILKKVGLPGLTMLPVIDGDRFCGVLTKADLLHLVNKKTKLETIMKTSLLTVFPDDRVIHARRIIVDNNVARLPVIDDGKVVGMIAEREVAFAFAALKRSFSRGHQKHRLEELLVKDVMNTPVITAKPDITAEEAAQLMLKENVGALPIVKQDNTIVGIVTRTDLLKTISC